MPSTADRNDSFIELGRTFHELSEHSGESDDIDLSQVLHVRSELTWDDILAHPRTVVLSEAGSGKTQELRHLALKLRAVKRDAYFLRLEFISEDFDIAFDVGNSDEFKAWLASTDQDWVFLDSVDEARLRSPLDFEKAIRKLGKMIDAAKERVCIIMTGRTHAWRPKTDFDLCNTQLSFPPQLRILVEETSQDVTQTEVASDAIITKSAEATMEIRFKVVALDDLSHEQVSIFATSRGVNNSQQFLDGIERADAWPLTTRPQDLEDLIALWNKQGQIGTRFEIMENSVKRRLSERDQQRAHFGEISDDRVYEGATLVAASATLAQSQIICVPDGSANTKGLLAKSVLGDWTEKEISDLLSRPIFDDAIYGTVRFHHRSVREYLTAIWLKNLLERSSSRRAIEALLFKSQYGVEVIVPTMRPVLPWLVIFDTPIRQRVLRIAPEVIFEGGDPSALPLTTRREILADICRKLAQHERVNSATEYAAVQRFALPDIASDISTLLAQYTSSDSVIAFLMRMIWLGRLQSLSAEAKAAALSTHASQYTRIAAFRAVKEIGSAQDQTDVRQAFLHESDLLNREWIGELVTDLPPSRETIIWVLEAVEKSGNRERYNVDRMDDAVTSFTDATPMEHLPFLISGILKLLQQPPVIELRYCEVSERFSWLMKAAAHAVERLIESHDGHALEENCLEIIFKFCSARQFGDELKDIKVQFASLVPEWRDLNDASFWHGVGATRQSAGRNGERLTDYRYAQIFGAFWKFSTDDFLRVVGWINSREQQDDKLVALTLAFAIYVENGRHRAWRAQLKSACKGHQELEERLSLLLNTPPPVTEYRKQERKWRREAATRTKKQTDQLERDRKYISERVHLLRIPNLANPADVSQMQWYLHCKLREGGKNHAKWTEGHWRPLVPVFGEAVAEAYRDGSIAYWRKYTPLLRSEGAEVNKTPIMAIFGLNGLGIEFHETPLVLNGLSAGEAEIAARYALYELNGFPSWFPTFYNAHRNVASRIILNEIRYEIESGVPDQDCSYVLSDVAWSAKWSWNDLAPSLFLLLETTEPQNITQLHQLLTIIQGSDISDTDIARLAAAKIATGNSRHLPDWFAVWVDADPDTALSALAEHLATMNDTDEGLEFAMNFVTKLWGGRRSNTLAARERVWTPPHLKALYILTHEHIRVSEDINRPSGQIFSPGLRDGAQNSRNRILEELNKIPGKVAFVALQEIKASSQQTEAHPYLEHLCRRKAEQESDLSPWLPKHFREFHEGLDRTPSTHRELAELAVLRFLDLKDDLENGDDSVAAIIKSVTEETKLRTFIGHQMRQNALGRYSIPQEEELADAKRPDLRFHGVAIDAPVPVELKIAENWTGPDLFERLENQLAGDYLRDVRSGRGILVLIYRGESAVRWQLPTTKQLVGFDVLLLALQEHWASIAPKFPGVDEITVIGIDLSQRHS